jgi:anaerobic C4-dicarboxylate transporter DcuA
MIWVDLAIVLACIFFGARIGGIALGTIAAVGMAVLVFACGRQPGDLPIEVIRIILCVICAVATLEAAGGLYWMVHVAERILRKQPQWITLVAPLVSYFFTFFAGTGHVTYAILPVIADVAHTAGVRPERPLSIAVIASQQAITACPLFNVFKRFKERKNAV